MFYFSFLHNIKCFITFIYNIKGGVKMEVQPFKNMGDIDKIKRYLLKKGNMRNYNLFIMGINVGLRISDLLSLKLNDVWNFETFTPFDEVVLKEQKTEKIRRIKLNQSVKDSLRMYVDSLQTIKEDGWLFQSRKKEFHLTYQSVNRMINQWVNDCRIKGNYGSHSFRKTFSYHLYMNNSENPMILPYLMKILNHSSQSITLRYIGIEGETINNLYDDLNL